MGRLTAAVGAIARPQALVLVVALVVGAATNAAAGAQALPQPDAQARRVNERIKALRQEAERLAGESRTLLGDLRKLEIERDLRAEEARQAQVAVAAARDSLKATTERVAALERQREAQLPDVRAQLVDLYKHGRSGYARLLFGAHDVREFARATRAVAALSAINEKRLAEHRATVQALRAERARAEERTRTLQAKQEDADRARAAAERAVASRSALIARIDSQRDLTAQYMGELQVAYDRLQEQFTGGRTDRVAVPLGPFRGALDWPVAGRVTARFGQTNRQGGAAVRNGIEIAAAEGASVRAVHGGTVAYADSFVGFGTLVILDHGANDFTLYGYLGSAAVSRGDVVDAGAELGRVGPGPGVTPALYFEMRIGGRSADPLQWLKPR